MISLPRPSVPAHSVGVLIVLALAPLWLSGMFGRGLWTPDEPREADIAWRMSQQSDRTLPQLAGTPFLEKPPLSYWVSGAAISLFGDSAGGARAPNLLYAMITALAVGALALAMQTDAVSALIAALVAASALTAFRVSIWLAPDACLLAGSAVSLLGAWLGYRAPPGPHKAALYTLMHFGAAIGFMAKSVPGWLVPALALITLIVWERRWSELRRWELYVGLTLQGLIIGPWVFAVTHTEHGADALRALFWHNVVGRFTQVAAPATLDYTTGHHNTPGKYLFELPLYLLPWTLAVAAALCRAWTRVREAGPSGTAWRFAVGSSLPFLALLSVAATARDIYAAPALLGLAVLTGLWACDAQRSPTRLDQLAVTGTRTLVAALSGVLVAALGLLIASGAGAPLVCLAAALAAGISALTALLLAARSQHRGDLQRSLTWTYTGYAAALCFTALAALPVVDRWQDLPGLARRIHADCARQMLALLDPDETTIAILDRGLNTRFTILTSSAHTPRSAVTGWFSAHGREARVLVLMPGHAPGALTGWLERLHPRGPDTDGIAGSLAASGAATLVQRYELPQGRRYALLGPPPVL
ncbi:MAG TPA: phospholipid carrier-dependent glycosyltransferase [Steroidobacteraceae bacterium]